MRFCAKEYPQNLAADQQFIQHLIMLLVRVFLLKNLQKGIKELNLIVCLKTIL